MQLRKEAYIHHWQERGSCRNKKSTQIYKRILRALSFESRANYPHVKEHPITSIKCFLNTHFLSFRSRVTRWSNLMKEMKKTNYHFSSGSVNWRACFAGKLFHQGGRILRSVTNIISKWMSPDHPPCHCWPPRVQRIMQVIKLSIFKTKTYHNFWWLQWLNCTVDKMK